MSVEVSSVAFQGVEVIPVTVQVQMASGMPRFSIVGLPDKAVAESRERVQAALHASGLSMPVKKVTVNLAPADLPKEGSHYDLPIALGLMAALEFVADPEKRERFDAELKVGARISAACLEEGMIARAMPQGDILGFAPPLVITREEIDKVVGIAKNAVDAVAAELGRD